MIVSLGVHRALVSLVVARERVFANSILATLKAVIECLKMLTIVVAQHTVCALLGKLEASQILRADSFAF